MSVSPARRAAYKVLARVRQSEAFSPPVLSEELQRRDLDDRESALATRLVYGTLQTEGTLDDALDSFAARPAGIEPQVRDVLRVAAYELLFLRTPPRAVVHQAVDAVRSARPQAAGLANAVLRRLAEASPSFPWGDTQVPEVLARASAHPRWLVEMWLSELGRDRAEALLSADNEPAPLYLVHNPFKGPLEAAMAALQADGAGPVPCVLEGCVRATVPSAAVRGRAVAEGLVLITDAAAQLAARCLDPRPGSLIWDAAAGRGTKTLELQASAVANGGEARILASDIHRFKTEVLERRMTELCVPGVTAVVADLSEVDGSPGLPEADTVDGVLLDAPCSGLGALRRNPEKRWRLSPEKLVELSALQSRMLAQTSRLVARGGVIVYSTCSISEIENGQVIRGFLQGEQGRAFELADITAHVPEEWRHFLAPEGWFQSIPSPEGPDGHFVASLRRTR